MPKQIIVMFVLRPGESSFFPGRMNATGSLVDINVFDAVAVLVVTDSEVDGSQ
jgi:hypothetical protein